MAQRLTPVVLAGFQLADVHEALLKSKFGKPLVKCDEIVRRYVNDWFSCKSCPEIKEIQYASSKLDACCLWALDPDPKTFSVTMNVDRIVSSIRTCYKFTNDPAQEKHDQQTMRDALVEFMTTIQHLPVQ